jgi:hypothetical protein
LVKIYKCLAYDWTCTITDEWKVKTGCLNVSWKKKEKKTQQACNFI